MIRSITERVYDAMSGATAIIYAKSTLENRDQDYIIRTVYFRIDSQLNIPVNLLAAEDVYTIEQVDGLFEALRPQIGSLPFTEMIKKGIEFSLMNFLATHIKYGVPLGGEGWEIFDENE